MRDATNEQHREFLLGLFFDSLSWTESFPSEEGTRVLHAAVTLITDPLATQASLTDLRDMLLDGGFNVSPPTLKANRSLESELELERRRTALLRERAKKAESKLALTQLLHQSLLMEVEALREAVVLRKDGTIACRVCGKLSKDGGAHTNWCTIGRLMWSPDKAIEDNKEGEET
jgi:hypothetical protein